MADLFAFIANLGLAKIIGVVLFVGLLYLVFSQSNNSKNNKKGGGTAGGGAAPTQTPPPTTGEGQ